MKKIKFFNLFGSYIRHKIKIIFLFVLFVLIFTVVFNLYALPPEAVLYASVLCAFFGIVFACIDFWLFYKKHRLLHELLYKITLSIEELPPVSDLLEKDYQELIQAIHQEKLTVISNSDNTRSAMTDYYSIWAHQIKTPIAAMRLLLQADDSGQNSELSAELFKIEQYAEMVLQYLRSESASTDYVISKYNLDDIVKQAIRKYAKMFIRKKINLDYWELNFVVLTDEKWLLFVLEQLLSNALKYTPEGKVRIYREDNTLVIEDTGMGIQEEDLPRLFENGFTGYNGRNDKKSTGIGLYLCKRILTKLSHTITIESKVDTGTKVKIGFITEEMQFD